MIKNKLFVALATSFILFGCSDDAPFGGTIDPDGPTSAQEADEVAGKAYEEVYDSYVQVFDKLIEEFNEESLDPDMFFAEYGITSVYDEKVMQMENEALEAQDELDHVLQKDLGNKEDWEIWTNKMNELYIQKIIELEEAYEVMLDY